MVGHFGLRGEVKLAAADGDLLHAGLQVAIAPSVTEAAREGRGRTSRIVQSRPHNKLFVVKLEDVDDAEAARALHGATLLVERAELPALPARAFRAVDLVGLEVVDEALGTLGTVKAVSRYPASDMLVVGPKGLLVPLLSAYGVKIDRKAKLIRVRLPPGFDEL